MKRLSAVSLLISAALLAGCVSTQMRSLVGQPIEEALLQYGQPVQVIPLQDGRRAYQFRHGGGPIPVAGYSTTTVTSAGPVASATTMGVPGGIAYTEGCLIAFYARERAGVWTIEGVRPPRELVC